jgi:CRISPR-associated endonuclease Csn1
MGYRLGLDLGANSIGWCCLALDPQGHPSGILAAGVRVYPDGRNPKDGSSLAAARRLPRSMRRNRDRYLQRRGSLLNALIRLGLMPSTESEQRQVASLDPYRLRADALARRLTAHEFGRVLFHLNQHRGFKSNRKVDKTGDNEGGLIRDAARELQTTLAREGHNTLGSYLAARHANREGVRVRLAGTGKMAAYPFYPLREMVEAEFNAVWEAQAGHLGLSDDAGRQLRRIIFHQRPLKARQLGRCWLEPGEDRGYRAMPSGQAYRIAQDLAHLCIQLSGLPERPLSDTERADLEKQLLNGKNLSFDRIRKLLKLPADTDFNLATLRKQELVGAETAHKLGSRKLLGDAWHALTLETQDAVVAQLIESETDDEVAAFIAGLGFDRPAALAAANVSLPDGTTSLSLKAMRRILPHFRQGMRYNDAVKAAGYGHHSDQRTGEIRDLLPYYGELLFERLGTGSGIVSHEPEKRWGRAPNPTVHVALNELRRVVNAIIEAHGKPDQIVIETLRELGRSAMQRREVEREQKKNQEANERRKQTLRELGLPTNGDNLMRLRLWEEQATDPLKRLCPYTGQLITERLALSDAVEEDHILPFARTLDDSTSNRVLVLREANRQKSRRTPFEAFGHTPQWADIQDNIEALPPSKRWRFASDALQKFAADGDFLGRHLADSATIARLARMYLDVLVPGHVWTTPGRMTGLLRAKLGINTETVLGRSGPVKSRTDHRHHAIDAVVVALTDRGLLRRVSTAAARGDIKGRLLDDLDEPWAGFVQEVKSAIARVVVSHKPDIGWQGALHNDTAYGPVNAETKKAPNVVVRRPLESLAEWSSEDILKHVRDAVLGGKIAAAVKDGDKSERRSRLQTLTHSGGKLVRRVRTVERLDNVAALKDRRTEKRYKLVKLDSNHRVELWRLPNGKHSLVAVSTLDAAREALHAQKSGSRSTSVRPHPAAKRLLRLHKNDMVAVEAGSGRQIMRVVKMTSGNVTLAPHNEGGNLKARDAAKGDPFKYLSASGKRLLEIRVRKVWVDPAGRVRDPGPLQ